MYSPKAERRAWLRTGKEPLLTTCSQAYQAEGRILEALCTEGQIASVFKLVLGPSVTPYIKTLFVFLFLGWLLLDGICGQAFNRCTYCTWEIRACKRFGHGLQRAAQPGRSNQVVRKCSIHLQCLVSCTSFYGKRGSRRRFLPWSLARSRGLFWGAGRPSSVGQRSGTLSTRQRFPPLASVAGLFGTF